MELVAVVNIKPLGWGGARQSKGGWSPGLWKQTLQAAGGTTMAPYQRTLQQPAEGSMQDWALAQGAWGHLRVAPPGNTARPVLVNTRHAGQGSHRQGHGKWH